MSLSNFKLSTRVKRKAPESGPVAPPPVARQSKRQKTMVVDPFRHVIFDEPHTAAKQRSGSAQQTHAQSKKRKTPGSDPFRTVTFDGPSTASESGSGNPQPTSPQQKKRKTDSHPFRYISFEGGSAKTSSEASEHIPQQRKPRRKGKTYFPIEIWGNIMKYCDFPTIRTLESTHEKFAKWVEPDFFWQDRNRHYYPSNSEHPLPPTPPGLSEGEYANLLEGKGCMKCLKKKSTKTYWAFSKRWCKECFTASIIRDRDIAIEPRHLLTRFDLMRCLNTAVTDSWGIYECAGATAWSARRYSYGYQPVYLRDDVKALSDRVFGPLPVTNYTALMDPYSADAAELKQWLKGWAAAEGKRRAGWTAAVLKVEWWEREERKRKRKKKMLIEGRRRVLFAEKARMELGMELDQLEASEAFQQSVVIAKEPSEKAWAHLRRKLT